MTTEGKLALPQSAHFVGSFQGFSLYYAYAASGAYSSRALVYVFACSSEDDAADFAQVCALQRESGVEWEESDIQLKLAKDAVRRAKGRIHHHSYEVGRVYAIELNERGVNCSFELGATV